MWSNLCWWFDLEQSAASAINACLLLRHPFCWSGLSSDQGLAAVGSALLVIALAGGDWHRTKPVHDLCFCPTCLHACCKLGLLFSKSTVQLSPLLRFRFWSLTVLFWLPLLIPFTCLQHWRKTHCVCPLPSTKWEWRARQSPFWQEGCSSVGVERRSAVNLLLYTRCRLAHCRALAT